MLTLFTVFGAVTMVLFCMAPLNWFNVLWHHTVIIIIIVTIIYWIGF